MFSLKHVTFHYSRTTRSGSESFSEARGIRIDSLDIPATGMTAIIGPSGSGKTTLLSILAGFLAPSIDDGGHAAFNGRAFGRVGQPPGRISFVFQSAMLLGAANGAVNMLQGIAARRENARLPSLGETQRLLSHLGLDRTNGIHISKRARHLSGGEKQRLAIIRALLADPEAVLCDEPTSSLDEDNANRVLSTLKSWSKEMQRPVVWVTHNLEQAAKYADHYVFVSEGRVKQLSQVAQEQILQTSVAGRADVLRAISQKLRSEADEKDRKNAQGNAAEAPTEQLNIGRLRYATWIANALSTDGYFVDRIERTRDGVLIPETLFWFDQEA